MSASPSSLHVTCHCRYVQDSAPPFVLSLPLSANATDLLDTVLGHAGLSKDKLKCANFRVAYKLFSPHERHGPIADFVHPHTDASIEAFFVRVPENDSGEKVLDVSIFSEDRNIFEKTIPKMVWSPPKSLVKALDDDEPPPNQFQCMFVHKDTNFRFPMSLPASLTGRQLKEKIRISSFYEVSVAASDNDPSLPAKVADESLDVEVHINGSSRSPGLKCKLFDAWPLRAAVLAITDETYFCDEVTVVFAIRSNHYSSSTFASLPYCCHEWPLFAPVLAKFIMHVANFRNSDSDTITLEDALQNRIHMCVWAALARDEFTLDPRQAVLKDVADHLHFHKDKIQGMGLLEAIRGAAR